MTVDGLVQAVRSLDGCSVLPACGLPVLRGGEALPEDLRRFYELCGGITLFASSPYSLTIAAPSALERANLEIVGAECPGDISDTWYIVARGGTEEAISIDCHPARSGRCYDSFWDRHGVVGSCAVVAVSFLELLQRLVAANGGYWYWLEDSFEGHGDAYPVGAPT